MRVCFWRISHSLFYFSSFPFLSTREVRKDWPRITAILAGGYQTPNTGESVLQCISLCSSYSRIPVSFLLSTILLVTYPLFSSSKLLTLCIFSWLRFTYCAHTPSSSLFWYALVTTPHFYLAIYSLLAIPLGHCGWDVMPEQAQNILVDIGLEVPYTCHARSAIVVWWILFVLEAVCRYAMW